MDVVLKLSSVIAEFMVLVIVPTSVIICVEFGKSVLAVVSFLMLTVLLGNSGVCIAVVRASDEDALDNADEGALDNADEGALDNADESALDTTDEGALDNVTVFAVLGKVRTMVLIIVVALATALLLTANVEVVVVRLTVDAELEISDAFAAPLLNPSATSAGASFCALA